MSSLLNTLRNELASLEQHSLRRQRRSNTLPCGPWAEIGGRRLLSFCSNDYLGLAAEPALAEALTNAARRWGTGSGASHLVSGHYTVHDALEQRLAEFVDCERALYFSTGYMVNSGIIAALAGRGDAVFADRLNHASLVDGVLLSRAQMLRYPHRDLAALESMLTASTAGHKVIVTDSVFSMDGDIAPLAALLALAERFDAWLVVDDAHGFGILGPQGRGALAEAGLQSWRLICIGTLGKAAGVSGAFAAGHKDVVEWLLQKVRTYIFTTGSPPALAGALLTSLELIEHGDSRRSRLRELIDNLHDRLHTCHWKLLPSRTPIQPLKIGSNENALRLAKQLDQANLWIPAIRPPTVPTGTARLRISLTAAHSAEDIALLANTLNRLEEATLV